MSTTESALHLQFPSQSQRSGSGLSPVQEAQRHSPQLLQMIELVGSPVVLSMLVVNGLVEDGCLVIAALMFVVPVAALVLRNVEANDGLSVMINTEGCRW